VDAVANGVIEIRGESGKLGLGVAAPEPYVTGETPEACWAALASGALDWLIGEDVREINRLCRVLEQRLAGLPAARAAVDMALHDLLGQDLDRPLVDLLGRAHEAMATSITIGIKPMEETLEEADEYLGRGFRILKVKLGQSFDEDVERLHRLRERVGSSAWIRVDANQGYSPAQFSDFLNRVKDLDIEFIEQPIPVSDTGSLRDLDETIRDRIALDESLVDESDALRWLQAPRPAGIYNIKLMKCGGVRPALRIATLAEIAGVRLMWGCMDESVIGIAAALHAALASPATRYLDLDGSLDLARDLAEGGFRIDDGVMRTTGGPGLGVTALDPG
jgi:L-Ala-D/L-Glu epimerase